MNAAAGLCVCCCALGPPICGAAPDLHTGWEKDSRGADLTASVDLTAFERCDRRHRSAVRQRFIFWTTHPRRRRAAKQTAPFCRIAIAVRAGPSLELGPY